MGVGYISNNVGQSKHFKMMFCNSVWTHQMHFLLTELHIQRIHAITFQFYMGSMHSGVVHRNWQEDLHNFTRSLYLFGLNKATECLHVTDSCQRENHRDSLIGKTKVVQNGENMLTVSIWGIWD